jgi:3-oxoacyl-[acyl-carrier protein] reductase
MSDFVNRRTAFVTGSAQGLGAAIGKSLLSSGYRVAFADINVEKARLALDGVALDQAAPIQVDVRSKSSILAAVDECTSVLGPIDILVNNAALTVSRDFFEISVEEWDEVIAVNLRSVVLTAQATARGMIERGWGRIINMTSLSGQRGGPQVQGIHYSSSKAGIIGITRYLAHQLAPSNITVNAISPGPILTEQTALAPKEKLAAVAGQIPMGRLGRADEVGALASYLASDEAGFVTGMTLDINGGLLMR